MILSLLRVSICTLILFQGALFGEDIPEQSSRVSQEQVLAANEESTPQTTPSESNADNKQVSSAELDSASRPEVPTYEGAFVKMLIVLLVLIFVIFFVIWLIRRLTHHRIRLFNQTRHIKIIERRPLSPKTALYILEIGEKKVLVAESQLEVKALATFEELSTSDSEV